MYALLLLLTSLWSVQLATAAAVGNLQPLAKRADACTAKDVKPVVSVLKILKASPFCTKFLSLSAKTVTATSTVLDTSFDTLTISATIVRNRHNPINNNDDGLYGHDQDANDSHRTLEARKIAIPTRKRIESCALDILLTAIELVKYGQAVVTKACNCYVTAPTVSVTAAVTAATTETITVTDYTRSPKAFSTEVLTETSSTSTTVAITISTTLTDATTQTLIETVSTRSTSTVTVPRVVVVSRNFEKVSSGTGCTYDDYIDARNFPNAASLADASKLCAIACIDESACKFYWAFHRPTLQFPYACRLDNKPFQSNLVHCGVAILGEHVGYNGSFDMNAPLLSGREMTEEAFCFKRGGEPTLGDEGIGLPALSGGALPRDMACASTDGSKKAQNGF
ncbi:MAG: hypothetical protein M1837_003977 [Sclerophora amabilis]|nr:MAG: hypothetical protein M1837_003977 [Sclerophora amabilis]